MKDEILEILKAGGFIIYNNRKQKYKIYTPEGNQIMTHHSDEVTDCCIKLRAEKLIEETEEKGRFETPSEYEDTEATEEEGIIAGGEDRGINIITKAIKTNL